VLSRLLEPFIRDLGAGRLELVVLEYLSKSSSSIGKSESIKEIEIRRVNKLVGVSLGVG
jgi:hypothetical protein